MLARRRFLTLAFGLVSLAAGIAISRRTQPMPSLPVRTLSGLVGDALSAAAVGRRILAIHPALAHGERTRHLLERLDVDVGHGIEHDIATYRMRYETAIREDFSSWKTIDVDGWQLARIEAELYVALALAA